MDHDGAAELIVSLGTCDVDWTNMYAVTGNGQLVEVGGFYGTVSLYAVENGDGIYSVYAFGVSAGGMGDKKRRRAFGGNNSVGGN